MPRDIVRFVRYFGVSLLALGVDVSTFAVLADLVPVVIAGGLSYGAGLVLHYAVSAGWVFADRDRWLGDHRAAEMTAFMGTGLAGLAITTTVIWVGTSAGLTASSAKAAAVVVSFVGVYVLRDRLVFRTRSGDA